MCDIYLIESHINYCLLLCHVHGAPPIIAKYLNYRNKQYVQIWQILFKVNTSPLYYNYLRLIHTLIIIKLVRHRHTRCRFTQLKLY